MSKRRLVVPCLVLALAGVGASSAQAQISPAPNTFTISGPAMFSTIGGPPISCTVTMGIAVSAGGMTGSVSSFNIAGSPFCSAIVGTALPWSVQRVHPGSMPMFEIRNVRITGVFGFCDKGTIRVAWDNTTLPGIGYADTVGTMPGNFNGLTYPAGGCELDGTWTVTSGGPVSVL